MRPQAEADHYFLKKSKPTVSLLPINSRARVFTFICLCVFCIVFTACERKICVPGVKIEAQPWRISRTTLWLLLTASKCEFEFHLCSPFDCTLLLRSKQPRFPLAYVCPSARLAVIFTLRKHPSIHGTKTQNNITILACNVVSLQFSSTYLYTRLHLLRKKYSFFPI